MREHDREDEKKESRTHINALELILEFVICGSQTNQDNRFYAVVRP